MNRFEKKFVCLNYTPETNKLFFDFATKNNFDLSVKYDGSSQDPKDFRFHTTIYYTTNKLDSKNQTIEIEEFEVTPDHFELLGVDKDIPVLKLKNKGKIRELRNCFADQGYKDSWPDYKPHISLSYEKKNYNLKNINLPDFSITACSFTVEKQ